VLNLFGCMNSNLSVTLLDHVYESYKQSNLRRNV
jgi:hypothetical protein